jgi:hypothetical protein
LLSFVAPRVVSECWLPRRPRLFHLSQQRLGFGLQISAQFTAPGDIGFGFFQLALRQPYDAAIAIGVGQKRVEPQRLVEIRGSSRQMAKPA